MISSFFGICSIYLMPEDQYWSSGIVAYRPNLLRNVEPVLVEVPKMSRPLLYMTPLVGNRKSLIVNEEI